MEKEMTDEEFQMFGMSKGQIEQEYIKSFTTMMSGIEMTVMSILSDAQHVLEYGNVERAKDQSRKLMNIAKYILSKELEYKMEKKKVA
jgi:hypothetical protein